MVAAEAGVAKQRLDPAAAFGWQSRPMALSQPAEAKAEALATLKELVGDPDGSVVSRNRSAYEVTWLERDLAANPLLAGCLTVGDAVLLCLPGELFVEYQLAAQACRPDKFVATAAYSDNGLWYVPTAAEYPKGGYEVGVTFAADRGPDGVKEGCEQLEGEYVAAIADLLEVTAEQCVLPSWQPAL